MNQKIALCLEIKKLSNLLIWEESISDERKYFEFGVISENIIYQNFGMQIK